MKKMFFLIALLAIANIAYGFEETVELEEGWNLVTISTEPSLDTETSLEKSTISASFVYDFYEEQYIRLHPYQEIDKWMNFFETITDSEDISDDLLLSNSAVWIYSKEQQGVEFTPTIISPKDLNLKEGWNFITITPYLVDYSIEDLGGDCNYQGIYLWDARDEMWEELEIDEEFEEEDLWKGIIARVNEDCTLGAEIPEAPVVPDNFDAEALRGEFGCDLDEFYTDLVFLEYADINNKEINPENPIMIVEAGEGIKGEITVEAVNEHGPGAIVPLAATPTWGDHATSYWIVAGHVPEGRHTFSTEIDLTAPEEKGTYYIIIANAGQIGPSYIMSASAWHHNTNHWNNGYDAADWIPGQLEHAIRFGWTPLREAQSQADDLELGIYGATAIKVKVI